MCLLAFSICADVLIPHTAHALGLIRAFISWTNYVVSNDFGNSEGPNQTAGMRRIILVTRCPHMPADTFSYDKVQVIVKK